MSKGKINVIDREGKLHQLEAEKGLVLMEIIRDADLPIEAACGGCAACATCHVFVNPEWISKVGERREMENSMLEFSDDQKANSRLACQIQISEEHEGLTVEIPEAQY